MGHPAPDASNTSQMGRARARARIGGWYARPLELWPVFVELARAEIDPARRRPPPSKGTHDQSIEVGFGASSLGGHGRRPDFNATRRLTEYKETYNTNM